MSPRPGDLHQPGGTPAAGHLRHPTQVIRHANGLTQTRHPDGVEVWTDPHGRLHRDDGPALSGGPGPDTIRSWWQHNQLHRLDGPAVEHPDGGREWFVRYQLIDGSDAADLDALYDSPDPADRALLPTVLSLWEPGINIGDLAAAARNLT